MNQKLTMLMILDGFGNNQNESGNAIEIAKTPNIDELMKKNPTTTIYTSGLNVGLPDGQMGNSEVGHTNIGAGRIVYQELTRITKAIEDAKEMLQDNPDKDFEEMLQLEIEENKEKITSLEEELKILLLPKDPNNENSVIVEIRGGTGGDEAALFAGALFRIDILSSHTRGRSGP